jgi:uncharacterized membrane protein YdjX (TVP38/TMEM64 family)
LIIHQDVGATILFFDSLGAFAKIFFIFLVILEVTLAPIPPLMLYVVAGVLFGAFWGGTLTLFGNLIGSLIDFEIARSYGRKFIEKLVTPKVKNRFDKFFEKYGGFSIFLLRINPFTTTDLFSYLAGLTKMKRSHFILGTTLGLIPLIYIQTYFGEIFVKENKVLYSIVIAVSLLYLALIVYFLIKLFIVKAREKRKSVNIDLQMED